MLRGARADSKTRGDHLVRMTFDKQSEYFPLAGCQLFEAAFNFNAPNTLLYHFALASERLIDSIE